jgi:tRNA(adenine34) deaminase
MMLLTDAEYMNRALACARDAAARDEVPVGAVLVGIDGGVLAEAGNAPISSHDPSAHAEMLVLRETALKRRNYRLTDTTLFVTLEPCPMCAGALVHARVRRVVYGAADPRAGACGSVFDIVRSPALNHRLEVCGGVAEPECAALLRTFFAARR